MAEHDTNDVLEIVEERAETGGLINGMMADAFERSEGMDDSFLWNMVGSLLDDGLPPEQAHAAVWVVFATDVYADVQGDNVLSVGQSTALSTALTEAAEDGLLLSGGDE